MADDKLPFGTSVDLQCEQCGKEYRKPASWVRRRKHHFCSRQCRGLSIRVRGDRSCLVCGKAFHAIPSRVARGEGIYCSKKCHGEHVQTMAWDQNTIKKDGCTIWTGPCLNGSPKRKSGSLRKQLWEAVHGPVPEGMCVVQTCPRSAEGPCIKPEHLKLRARYEFQNRRKSVPLKPHERVRIAQLYDTGLITQIQLSTAFGVTQTAISRILRSGRDQDQGKEMEDNGTLGGN